MTDSQISHGLIVIFIIAIAATGVSIGVLINQACIIGFRVLPRLIKWLSNLSSNPDTGDRLVGITVAICGFGFVICGVVFLISDYANDWQGAL